MVTKEADGSNCHAVIICRFNSNIIKPQFASQYLNSSIGQARLRGLHVGSSLPHINTSELGRFRIPLPSLHEQNRIADVLTTWDFAIEKNEQLIAAKERQHWALSTRLLFGLMRFEKCGVSKTKLRPSLSALNVWPVVEIGEIAREVSVVNNNGDEWPVLSCTKYAGLVRSLEYFNRQVFSSDTSKYKLVRRGQFAYATNHIEEGAIGYQDVAPAGLVSPIYTVFEADTTRVDDGYFYKLLKTHQLRQFFAASTSASVDRRGSLRWKDFARIRIPLPPLEEQRSINAVLNTSRREIDLLRSEVSALKTQKLGLMQKLLTGEWRLSQADQEAV